MFRDRTVAFLEHEQLRSGPAQFRGKNSRLVEVIVESVADDDHGLYRPLLGLFQGLSEHALDLDIAAADALGPAHVPRHIVGIRDPSCRDTAGSDSPGDL